MCKVQALFYVSCYVINGDCELSFKGESWTEAMDYIGEDFVGLEMFIHIMVH